MRDAPLQALPQIEQLRRTRGRKNGWRLQFRGALGHAFCPCRRYRYAFKNRRRELATGRAIRATANDRRTCRIGLQAHCARAPHGPPRRPTSAAGSKPMASPCAPVRASHRHRRPGASATPSVGRGGLVQSVTRAQAGAASSAGMCGSGRPAAADGRRAPVPRAWSEYQEDVRLFSASRARAHRTLSEESVRASG